MYHCVGAIDGDLRRTVRLSRRRLLQHLSLLRADGEAEVPGCIRKVGERGAVTSKQQLSNEFLIGFRACEETPKVEQTKVCSETDVNAV